MASATPSATPSVPPSVPPSASPSSETPLINNALPNPLPTPPTKPSTPKPHAKASARHSLPYYDVVKLMTQVRDHIHEKLHEADGKQVTGRTFATIRKWVEENREDEYLKSINFTELIPFMFKSTFFQAFTHTNTLKPFTLRNEIELPEQCDVRAWEIFSRYKFSATIMIIDLMRIRRATPSVIGKWYSNPGTSFEIVLFLMFFGRLLYPDGHAEDETRSKRARVKAFPSLRLVPPAVNRFASAVQAIIRAWDAVAHVFKFKSIEDLTAPYIIFNRHTYMFTPLKQNEGFAPRVQSMYFEHLRPPTTDARLTYPAVTTRSEAVDIALRQATATFLDDLSYYLLDDTLFQHEGETWPGMAFLQPSETTILAKRFDSCGALLTRLHNSFGDAMLMRTHHHSRPPVDSGVAVTRRRPPPPPPVQEEEEEEDADEDEDDDDDVRPLVPMLPAVPTVPTVPAVPTVPTIPTIPTIPTMPTIPTIPTIPAIPAMPTIPALPTTTSTTAMAMAAAAVAAAEVAAKEARAAKAAAKEVVCARNATSARNAPSARKAAAFTREATETTTTVTQAPSTTIRNSQARTLDRHACAAAAPVPTASGTTGGSAAVGARRTAAGSIVARAASPEVEVVAVTKVAPANPSTAPALAASNGTTPSAKRRRVRGPDGSNHGNKLVPRSLEREDASRGDEQNETLAMPPLSIPPACVMRFVSVLWRMTRPMNELCDRATHHWPKEVIERLMETDMQSLLATEAAGFNVLISVSRLSSGREGLFAGKRFVPGEVICNYYGILAYECEVEKHGTKTNEFFILGTSNMCGATVERCGVALPNLTKRWNADTHVVVKRAYVIPSKGCVASRVVNTRYGADDTEEVKFAKRRATNACVVRKRRGSGISKKSQLCETDGIRIVASRTIQYGEEICAQMVTGVAYESDCDSDTSSTKGD